MLSNKDYNMSRGAVGAAVWELAPFYRLAIQSGVPSGFAWWWGIGFFLPLFKAGRLQTLGI